MKTKKIKIEIIALIVSIVSLLSSGIFVPLYVHFKNEAFTREMQTQTKIYEQTLREKDAIPILRLVDYKPNEKQLLTMEPDRELGEIKTEQGGIIPESYFSIRNFSFENVADNIAYVNHIEFGGEAFDIENIELTAIRNECISLTNQNLFIGSKYESCFYIIVKSKYEKYYSYKCNLTVAEKDGATYYYNVTSIDTPQEYDINNDVYKNRHINLKIFLYPDNIIF